MDAATANNGWVNTIDSQNPEVIAKATRIIANNLYCTLSTCSSDGYPWVSPVLFVYDDSWNMYWSSAIESQHSRNLNDNQGRIAITIFNSTAKTGSVEGLYLQGTASEAELSQIPNLLKLLKNRITKPIERVPEDYLYPSHRRFYHFCPQQLWVTGERILVGNQLVDTKIKLDLPVC